MKPYQPVENGTIRCSNLMFACVSWFWNNGQLRSCKLDEALFIDQRVFGPAQARGLIAHDGTIWFITEPGVAWVKNFLSRSAWKDHASRNFSHWIKVRRSQLKLVPPKTKAARSA